MHIGVAEHEGQEMPCIVTNVPLPPVPLLWARQGQERLEVSIFFGRTNEDTTRLFREGPGGFLRVASTSLKPPNGEDFLRRLLAAGQCLVIGPGEARCLLQAFVIDLGREVEL